MTPTISNTKPMLGLHNRIVQVSSSKLHWCQRTLTTFCCPLANGYTSWTHRRHHSLPTASYHIDLKRAHRNLLQAAPTSQELSATTCEEEVVDALRNIIDPDFGENIVDCGFVKQLDVDPQAGSVKLLLELTTPACPVKDMFERQAREYIGGLPWVRDVDIVMGARPPAPLTPQDQRPDGLRNVRNIIAVSSCKGGVGKSTVAVNLAFTLAQMGAKVGIFDADVYGPSLPTMISPELRVLVMDPDTRNITPVEYEGVKVVSFGFAGKGSAIMRGPMASGLIQQLLTTSQWGDLDYLVVDFPPGTGDIQLTLCQTVAFTSAVIVTTPQKLAFIDVAKGIRMFARLMVPCVAVVENMSYFEVDGVRHFPFGTGSGDRIKQEFGLPHLIKFPIVPNLSAAGDGGEPLVVSDPTCSTSSAFMELGAAVVREVAKLSKAAKTQVWWDDQLKLFAMRLPGSVRDCYITAATVRRNDTSAKSINEWTGEKMFDDDDIHEQIEPQSVNSLGNYAVQISWEDGFNQVASFDLLASLDRVDDATVGELRKQINQRAADASPETNAQKIMSMVSEA